MEYKPLNDYKTGSRKFKILERINAPIGDICISKQEGREHYEVFIVQKRKEITLNGHVYAAVEAPPAPSLWGMKGWSFIKKERAYEKFNSLQKQKPKLKTSA